MMCFIIILFLLIGHLLLMIYILKKYTEKLAAIKTLEFKNLNRKLESLEKQIYNLNYRLVQIFRRD